MPTVLANLHTIALLVRNKPGVLVRVALIFSRRGYNIESLVVSPVFDAEIAGYESNDHEFSRMTITCSGDMAVLDQIVKQLEKLVDVIHAIDHGGRDVIENELALVKVRVGVAERTEILQIAEHYRAKVVDYGPDSLIMRIQGESGKLDACIGLLERYRIIELVRSGKLLMARGTVAT
jgi:acetolactate synthase-1/3 small subunit